MVLQNDAGKENVKTDSLLADNKWVYINFQGVEAPDCQKKTTRWASVLKKQMAMRRKVFYQEKQVEGGKILRQLYERREVCPGNIYYLRLLKQRIKGPPPPICFFKDKSEVIKLQNYRKSDYALNKNSPNIVYRFHNEIIEITLEDYLKENPEKTEHDFVELKGLSDQIYYEQDRAESAQTHKDVSIHGLEETEHCATRSLEEEWEERIADVQNRKYAWKALEQLFTVGALTKVQKRRFRLHVFQGRSTRQIGRMEGKSHQAVAKSINLAIAKLKECFAAQG